MLSGLWPLLAVVFTWSLHAVYAIDLAGRIEWNGVCTDIAHLGQAKVTLDSGKLSGGIRSDGSFSIPGVKNGTYILSVLSHDFSFDTLRIDISPSQEVPEVRPYLLGTPLSPPSPVLLAYPIILAPRQKANYFVEPESFNLLGMLKNPMVLMMVVTGALVMGMPYLMKNLDPELANEVKSKQDRINNIRDTIQGGDIRGGISAFLAAAEEEAAAATNGASPSSKKTVTSPASNVKSRGGAGAKGKKRN